MRVIFTLLTAGALFGCGGLAVNVAPPGVDEFPQQELPFRVAGDNDTVLRGIQDYLVSQGLPSIVTVRAPRTFVVTTYIEEPRMPADRRVRRSAFRLGLSQTGANSASPCTSVAVVSLTKSRGIHEELWSIQESDTTFVSSAWPELKALLEKRMCK